MGNVPVKFNSNLEPAMRPLLLWLIGIPIPLIILIGLFFR